MLRRDSDPPVNSTTLDKSWNGAVLFSVQEQADSDNVTLSTSVDIICTACYVKGIATAQYTIANNLNVSQAWDLVLSEVETEIDNITTTFVDYAEMLADSLGNSVETYGIDFDDYNLPPLEIDLDIYVPDIPDVSLRFQFDGMELYMQLDTVLSAGATYTLNLFTSETPIGLDIEDLLIGVVVSIDLILSVDTPIDISSGFHIRLHDGVAVDIDLFSQNVSSIVFNGGKFEFLPVTVQNAGVILTALLRVSITAGADVSTPVATVDGFELGIGAGVVGAVWADVAQFISNVTALPAGDESGCELLVVEEYSMLLGANAGATIAVVDNTWGPSPETQVPIWFTTTSACAATRTTRAAASTSTLHARAGVTTTTSTTEITFTATACLSTGMLNCPASLQTTSKNIITQTLVAAVSSGSDASFAPMSQSAVLSTFSFGTNVQDMTSTSGSPVSYVPPPPPTSSASSNGTSGGGTSGFPVDGETDGVSNKLIIGLSVGLGVPALLAIVGCVIYYVKRKRYSAVDSADPLPDVHDVKEASDVQQGLLISPTELGGLDKASTRIVVTEAERRT